MPECTFSARVIMASWVEEIVTSLLAESRGIVHSREQSTSTRVVTWLIVNVPPEWIVFFLCNWLPVVFVFRGRIGVGDI